MRRITTVIKDKCTDLKAAAKRKKIEMTTNFKEDFTPNSQLTVEQRERKTMRSVSKITTGLLAASMMMSCMGITCFAADGTEGVDTFNTVVEGKYRSIQSSKGQVGTEKTGSRNKAEAC